MKYVLVCKNEPREQGYRCADIFDTIPWDAAPEHMWIECPDDFVADSKWFDPTDNTFKDFPIFEPMAINFDNQPITSGTQTI